MRNRTSDWFEVKVQYEKVQEDGQQKKVTELYVVDAPSFSEAEHKIAKEMEPYISGEYKVKNITPTNYHELFFIDDDKSNDVKWYKAKLQFITLDEKTEKEKRSNVCYLVQGNSTETAQQNLNEVMGGTMIDYDIISISETKILDVFEHGDADNEETPSINRRTIDEFE